MIVALGDAGDARGFRLAGVNSIVCRDAQDVQHAVRQLALTAQDTHAVVLVCPSAYRSAPDAVDRLASTAGGPTVLVLPASGDGVAP